MQFINLQPEIKHITWVQINKTQNLTHDCYIVKFYNRITRT